MDDVAYFAEDRISAVSFDHLCICLDLMVASPAGNLERLLGMWFAKMTAGRARCVCKSMWVRVGYVELRGGEVEAVCWGISSSGRALA